MKRHWEQREQDRRAERTLSERGIRRITAHTVNCDARRPGDFVICVCAKGPVGEQHNYMMVVNRDDLEYFEINPLDRDREMMTNCQRKELDAYRKRKQFCSEMGTRIAAALLDHIEKNDPQFGYTRQQWDEMQSP